MMQEVRGRVDVVLMPPPTVSCQPKLGHISMSMTPRRFIVPPWFHHALQEWIKIPLPHSVPLSSFCFYDEWVQVTYHGG
jgi:hypothetical protein